MKYPTKANWVKIYKSDSDEYDYVVHNNLTDKKYPFTSYEVDFLNQLDGKTDPMDIDTPIAKEDIEFFLNWCKGEYVTRKSRIIFSLSILLFTLWVPKRTAKLKKNATILNWLLFISWLPVFLLGIHLYSSNEPIWIDDHFILGMILGLVSGIVLHELGHFIAALSSNKSEVYELGIGLKFLLPCAYNLIDCEKASRTDKIQIYAAGCEMNALLSGIFLMLATVWDTFASAFFMAAILNISMVALNMILITGFDGMILFSQLLGIDLIELSKTINAIVFKRNIRKRFIRKGLDGFAFVVVAYVLELIKIGYPLLLILNVLEVISWIRL